MATKDEREKEQRFTKTTLGKATGEVNKVDKVSSSETKPKAESKKSLSDTFKEISPFLIATALGGVDAGFAAQRGAFAARDAQRAQDVQDQQLQQKQELQERRIAREEKSAQVQEANLDLRRQEIEGRREDRALQLRQKDIQQAKKAAEKAKEFEVPGAGFAPTKDDAKKGKALIEQTKNATDALNQLIDLRQSKGAEIADRASVRKAQAIATDLKLAIKDAAGLGVLSKSDEALLDKLVPGDPLEINASTFGLGEDSTLAQMQEAKSLLENKLGNFFETRGMQTPILNQEQLERTQRQRLEELRAKHGRK